MTDLIRTHDELDALEARWQAAKAAAPQNIWALTPELAAKAAAWRAYHEAEMAPLERIARASFEALAGRPLRDDANPFSSLRLELDAMPEA